AELRQPAAQDHDRPDQGRGPPLPVAHGVRAPPVRAEEGAMMRASKSRHRLGSALLALGLIAFSAGLAVAADGTSTLTPSRLPNGFTVLVRENPWAPVVAYSLQVKMGNRWETRENAGISNLLQLMLV